LLVLVLVLFAFVFFHAVFFVVGKNQSEIKLPWSLSKILGTSGWYRLFICCSVHEKSRLFTL